MHLQAWCLIALSYVALPAAWLASIDPQTTDPAWVGLAWFAFIIRTFTYHLGLLLLAVGIAAALWRQKKLALAALPLILFGVLPTWRHYLPKTPPPPTAAPLKVMSANLLYLNENTHGFIDQIVIHDPDVILFQEFTAHWRYALRDRLEGAYPYRVEKPLQHSFGAAIFSKTPFVEPPDLLDYSTPDTPQLRVVIEHNGGAIAVYNIHLMPPTSILNTIDQRRTHARLMQILRDETRPTILGGDFNFTSDSYMASDVRALGYTDTQHVAGRGPGTTWPVHSIFPKLPIPKLRIDHLYLNDQLVALDATTGEPRGSDHRPIISTLGFRAPAE
jgi:endonuclease/exonuclease/phosphatase (EEP) superfamily protein YafD